MEKYITKALFLSLLTLSAQMPLTAFWGTSITSARKNAFFQEIIKESSDIKKLEDLLDETPSLAQITFDKKVTPLHLAAKMGNVSLINLLLSHNARINSRTANGETPLHYAALAGKSKAVKALIQNGALVNTNLSTQQGHSVIEWGDTPLEYAIKSGDLSTVKALITRGASLHPSWNHVNNTKLLQQAAIALIAAFTGGFISSTTDNPLFAALGLFVYLYKLILLPTLARLGFDNNALVTAIQNENHDIIEYLLSQGASANEFSRFGTVPIIEAAKLSDIKTVKNLLANNALIDAQDRAGQTALSAAVKAQDLPLAAFLISKNANIDHKVAGLFKYKSILELALETQNAKMVDLLLNSGAYPFVSVAKNDPNAPRILAAQKAYTAALAKKRKERVEKIKADITSIKNNIISFPGQLKAYMQGRLSEEEATEVRKTLNKMAKIGAAIIATIGITAAIKLAFNSYKQIKRNQRLIEAALDGDLEQVKQLLSEGANPDMPTYIKHAITDPKIKKILRDADVPYNQYKEIFTKILTGATPKREEKEPLGQKREIPDLDPDVVNIIAEWIAEHKK